MKSSVPSASPVPPASPAIDAELVTKRSRLRRRGMVTLYLVGERKPFFSSHVSFIVQDEHGHTVYRIKGRLSYLGSHLSIQDLAGHEVAVLTEVLALTGYLPRYVVYCRGKKYATIVRDWPVAFELMGPGYAMKPNSARSSVHFGRGGRGVSPAASFWVERAETDDPVGALALVLAQYLARTVFAFTGIWLWAAVLLVGLYCYYRMTNP